VKALTLRNLDRAVPLLEAQYREHDMDMKGARLRRALRGLLQGKRGAGILADHGIAVVTYSWSVELGGLVAWLEELYVEPDFRGQGLGQRLLRAARALARRQGCVSMELEVVRGHERAARLYVREGFKDRRRTRYGHPL
jgi:GNAT superfamily N-acetyltransferase